MPHYSKQKYVTQWHAYLRLIRFHAPSGTLLLLWPPLWTLALLSGGMPPWPLLLAFIIGALLMRSAGCIINDMTDQSLDAHVERTRLRPLASGEVSLREASILLVLLLFFASLIALALGIEVFCYALISLPLIIAYPWMKRITYWPQLFLGITFNYGVILASVALLGKVHLAAVFMYLAAILWTLAYDTIYGFQDMKDDQKIGVKSTSLLLASNPKKALLFIYMETIGCMGAAVYSLALPWFYYLGLCAVMLHFTWQVIMLDPASPACCKKLFQSNAALGGIIFFTLLLPYVGT